MADTLPDGSALALANVADYMGTLPGALPNGTNIGDSLRWDGSAWSPFEEFQVKLVVPAGQNINASAAVTGNTVDFASAALTTFSGVAPTVVATGVPVPVDGDYRLEGSYHCTSPNNVRYSGIVRATVDGVLINEGQGAEGYIRDSAGDQDTGGDFQVTLALTAGQVVGMNIQRESGSGNAVTLVAGTRLSVQRVP